MDTATIYENQRDSSRTVENLTKSNGFVCKVVWN